MKYVALLRGINVGGNHLVKMADLRGRFEAGGASNVVTYIQSGNVVFDHPSRSPSKLTVELSLQLTKALRFPVALTIRTAGELAEILDEDPYPELPPEHKHIMFLYERVAPSVLDALELEQYEPDRLMMIGRQIYFALPNGLGRSKLAVKVSRTKALDGGTTRNWRTATTLLELSAKR